MSKGARSRPYRVPSVQHDDPWYVTVDSDRYQLPGGMPSWDYHRDLNFSRQLRLDSGKIRQDTGLGSDARIVVMVSCECKASFYRKDCFKEEIGNRSDERFEIEFTLPGEQLTSKIHLYTRILLDEEVSREHVTASKKGHILHEEVHAQELHGRAPRFPTTQVDFSTVNHVDAGACWFLVIAGDLETPTSQGIQLYLNSQKKQFLEKLGEEDLLVTSMLNNDLARQMLEHALSTDFDPRGDYKENSVGIALQNLYLNVFGDQGLEESKDKITNRRHEVEASIQGMMLKGKE